jgi:hypothetical protein
LSGTRNLLIESEIYLARARRRTPAGGESVRLLP